MLLPQLLWDKAKGDGLFVLPSLFIFAAFKPNLLVLVNFHHGRFSGVPGLVIRVGNF